MVAWDRPEKTFRHGIDDQYKANREKLDEDLRMQFPWMREVTELMGLKSLDEAGFEADDILASLAVQVSALGHEVRLFTNDKDLAQVVSGKVLQCPPPKQGSDAVIMGPADIEEKYGLPPSKMAEWQALVGDSSDNVKGMPGVGPKRATTLLQKYENLDAVLARGPEEEKGKLAENLGNFADSARLALRLVTMVTDMKLAPLEEMVPEMPDFEGVLDFCNDHGFNTLGNRFQDFKIKGGLPGNVNRNEDAVADEVESADDGPSSAKRYADGDYKLIRTAEELVALHDGLQASGGFAFDTETTSIVAMRARLVGMSFAWEAGKAYYVAENLPDPPLGPDGQSALEYLTPLLEDASLPKYGQNLKYDAHVMRRHGVSIQGWDFDTMVAHFLVDPISRHNLDSMSLQHLGMRKIPTKELLGTGKNALTMDLVPIDAVAEYACEDADATFQLVAPMRAGLKEVEAEKLFHDVELPLIGVLVRMEAEGIRVDKERLLEMRKTLGKRQMEFLLR